MILQNILLKHRNNDDNIIYYQSLGGSERTSRLVLCYKCKKMVVTLQHEGCDVYRMILRQKHTSRIVHPV